jgi:hypothetical protein
VERAVIFGRTVVFLMFPFIAFYSLFVFAVTLVVMWLSIPFIKIK